MTFSNHKEKTLSIKTIGLVVFLLLEFMAVAQPNNSNIQNPQAVFPPYWWANMLGEDQEEELTIAFSGMNIAQMKLEVNHPNIRVSHFLTSNNKNIILVKLFVKNIPGNTNVDFKFYQNEELKISYPFKFLSRKFKSHRKSIGDINQVTYHINIDRFSNEDVKYDTPTGFLNNVNLKDPYARHGGDIKGIIKHFDYIKSLGINTLGLSNLLESDVPSSSYRSDMTTRPFVMDIRLGLYQDFENLYQLVYQNNVSLAMDFSWNVVPFMNQFINGEPFDYLLTQTKTYKQSQADDFKLKILNDSIFLAVQLNSNSNDNIVVQTGWMNSFQPRLNLNNAIVSTFKKQQAVWLAEKFHLSQLNILPFAQFESNKNLSSFESHLKRYFPNIKIETKSHLIFKNLKKKIDQGNANEIYKALKEIEVNDLQKIHTLHVYAERRMLASQSSLKLALLYFVSRSPTLLYGDELQVDTERLKKDSKQPVNMTQVNTYWQDFPSLTSKKIVLNERIGLNDLQKEKLALVTKLNQWKRNSSWTEPVDFYYFPSKKDLLIGIKVQDTKKCVALFNFGRSQMIFDPSSVKKVFSEKNPEVLFDIITDKQYLTKRPIKIKPTSFLILESRG